MRGKGAGFADAVNDRRQHGQGFAEAHLVGNDTAHGLGVGVRLPLAYHRVCIAGKRVSLSRGLRVVFILQGAAGGCMTCPE